MSNNVVSTVLIFGITTGGSVAPPRRYVNDTPTGPAIGGNLDTGSEIEPPDVISTASSNPRTVICFLYDIPLAENVPGEAGDFKLLADVELPLSVNGRYTTHDAVAKIELDVSITVPVVLITDIGYTFEDYSSIYPTSRKPSSFRWRI